MNASQFNEKWMEFTCLHSRLALQTTPNGHLTGEYICEQCGIYYSYRAIY
jgi:hypothetical protein